MADNDTVADRLFRTAQRMRELAPEYVDHMIAAPATDAQLELLESRVGRPLPDAVRAMLEAHAALHLSWLLDDDVPLPAACDMARKATVQLSLGGVQQAEESRRDWVESCFGDPTDRDSLLWQVMFGIQPIANGDVLGVIPVGEHAGAVIYLSHEGGPAHGLILARSLADFLLQWSSVGFAGPEQWILQQLYGDDGHLDGRGQAAAQWRAAVGLSALVDEALGPSV